jgi:precorrin-2 dehydrogenase / sirohydrochlorin ferrochelatase
VMTRYYPMFTDVRGRTCLVVGGGRVAEGRVVTLVDHGARVRLVSPVLTPSLISMVANAETIELRQRTYRDSDLDEDCTLAIAATDSREVNRAVHRDARARRVPCNVADDPALCDFILPAVVRRGELALAVSTGGASPTVSAHVRERLEDVFGPEWGELIDLLGELRPGLKRLHPDPADRSARIRAVLESPVREMLARGDSAAARGEALRILGMEH